MAAGRTFSTSPSYRFQEIVTGNSSESQMMMFEFDESDYNNNTANLTRHVSSTQTPTREIDNSGGSSNNRSSANRTGTMRTGSSLPMNVPDWSKIYKKDCRRRAIDEDDEDEDVMIPPHEFLAKQFAKSKARIASYSLHEGVGRTLKGRDLSRVRDAIWKETGFELD